MSPSRYHPALRSLHWLIAVLVIAALFFATFVMAPRPNADPAKLFMLAKHMAAGLTVLLLTLVRLGVRPRTRRPAPVLSGISLADRIVPYVHRVFDALLLAVTGSGIALALASHLPAAVLGSRGALPATFATLPAHALHVFVARVLAGVVALHVVGALYHQFILRDGLFGRMAPALGRSR